ncbi:MAG TPA: hypothetical protein VES95_07650 [Dermatophilaceae bacterium]|nr:hypothetical protein [Dermatophilaceae bacterium]
MKKALTTTGAAALSVRWVPVPSTDGRVRMEMRWSTPPRVPRQAATA